MKKVKAKSNVIDLDSQRRKRNERSVDLTLEDLQGLRGTPLENLVDQAEEAWLTGLEKDSQRRSAVRCCTATISNQNGLGELQITFRFPLRDPAEDPVKGSGDLIPK